jgi:predicted NAD/FAD-dependent oxidoreductase
MSGSFGCDVLVVGAGMAGLMAAQQLQSAGKTVLVVDREERVGGRMLTEYLAGGWADTGAQFFTVREPRFGRFVENWLAQGLVFEWSTGWPDGSLLSPVDDSFTRYAAVDGMNAIPRYLAQDLTVHKAVRIQSVRVAEGRWTAVTESGVAYHSHALILTPPVPISLALLAMGQVFLVEADQAALSAIAYAPGLTAVCHIDGMINLPEPGAVQRSNLPVSWIADNRRKGISPHVCLVSVHINPTFSRLWWLSPDAELEGALRRELRPFLAEQSVIKEIAIHRWPYALPTTLHPERTLLAANLPPLAFAGDAFHGPRVEGAALSGLAAAEVIERAIG